MVVVLPESPVVVVVVLPESPVVVVVVLTLLNPISVVVCSSSMTPQPTTSDAAAMMAIKVFPTVPLIVGLDYLVHVCLWNKV